MRSAAGDPDGCWGWPASAQHNPAADGCSALDVTAMKSRECIVPPTHALVGLDGVTVLLRSMFALPDECASGERDCPDARPFFCDTLRAGG